MTCGKSWENNLIFALDMLGARRTLPAGDFLIVGQTMGIAYKNVVEPIKNMFPSATTKRVEGMPYLYLGKRRARIAGADNKESFSKFLGGVLCRIRIDEATKIPMEVINQCRGRLLPGGSIDADTNPDSVYHPLYQLVNECPADCRVFKFGLRDNPTLTEEKIQELETAFPKNSTFYKRYILGEWCASEGVIYDMFSLERHMSKSKPDVNKMVKLWGAGDIGSNNPTAFLKFGKDAKGKKYVLGEYYYDSHVSGRQKTHKEMCADLRRDFTGLTLYVDPSATDFKNVARQEGFRVVDAKNDVLLGINVVGNDFAKDNIEISPECKNLLRELTLYCWDERAQRVGKDAPLKANDHACDALRYGVLADVHSGELGFVRW